MDGFATSLSKADHVFLTNIFSSAREKSGDVSSEDLAAKLPNGGEIITMDSMAALTAYHDAVVVFMGAGDIQKYEKVYEDAVNAR